MLLEGYLRKARKLSTDGEAKKLQLMNLLADLYNKPHLWQAPDGPHSDWAALLKQEGFCTITLFRKFQVARKTLQAVDLRNFGVYASTRVATLPLKYRDKVIRRLRAWHQGHRIPPTYQRVTTYTKELVGVYKSRVTKQAPEVTRLKKRIRALEALLRKNNIPVPRKP